MTLTELCQELKNWFIRGDSDVHDGEFVIKSGVLEGADFLLENQYFRVEGSIFNDGVHQYGVDTLTDETFTGTISGMAIPPAVIELLKSISDWNDKYAASAASPYMSESWNGYSYSKGGGGSASGAGGVAMSWQNAFASQLNRWRKV